MPLTRSARFLSMILSRLPLSLLRAMISDWVSYRANVTSREGRQVMIQQKQMEKIKLSD